MKNLTRLACLWLDSGIASPAVAQSPEADVSTSMNTSGARTTISPRGAVNGSATQAALLPFGPFITQTGVGAGGASVSEVYTAVGYNSFGFGFQANALKNCVPDDFVAQASWDVDTVQWMAYQTGAPTSGTITHVELYLWNTDPTGQLPGGHICQNPASLQSQVWSGVYNVLDTHLTAKDRALIQVACDGNFMDGFLTAGTFWLQAGADGSLTSGPWALPQRDPGQLPGQHPEHHAVQSVAGGAFSKLTDGGNGDDIDLVFQLEGAGGGGRPVSPSAVRDRPRSPTAHRH